MPSKRFWQCHLAALLLVVTFLFPPTRSLWDALDLALFRFLNHTLEGRPTAQLFWALLNHKLTDWVEDIVFLTFFTIAIWQAPRGERTRRAAQLLFTILFAACVIFFINRVLFRETLHIPRDSPSIVVQPCIRLSDEVRWMSVKDDSHSSFPGDHATTLILFAACTTFFAGRRLGLYAILYAALRTLPRLVAGAHWFSDVAVGGGTIVLTTLAWGLCTPLHLWGTRMFERILSGRSWKIALRKTP